MLSLDVQRCMPQDAATIGTGCLVASQKQTCEPDSDLGQATPLSDRASNGGLERTLVLWLFER